MNARLILKQLPNHLIFRILHYSLVSQQLRDELGVGAGSSRLKKGGSKLLEWQPFALWLANLLLNYAGDALGNLLLGSLPLEPLCNTADILLCSVIWYCFFYCPFDLAYDLASTMAFRILATALSTISQIQLIDRGVHLAGKVYENAPVPMLIVGTVMGSGAEILKPVASLLINRCQHNQSAYLKLSNNSKLALFLSCLFMLEIFQSPLILGLNRHSLVVYSLVMTTAFKFLSLTYRTDHFIWLLEHQLRYILFGGLSRDLTKFFQRLSEPELRRTWAFSEFD
ncbi:trimeric intracellular cation channel type B isoform X1 [Drosophila gunungcola]|uniref:trimeric intracellular cation channel type B isoform X1 n=1 Tax=Drosophila gunungcola TaxID=103775 RepID=UPI0022E71980|nr:trimeric intracellular cation channel type B isoform X1 [Drosophila gunungcola]